MMKASYYYIRFIRGSGDLNGFGPRWSVRRSQRKKNAVSLAEKLETRTSCFSAEHSSA